MSDIAERFPNPSFVLKLFVRVCECVCVCLEESKEAAVMAGKCINYALAKSESLL